MPGTPETVLAFDFGLRRIGVAVGQQVTDSARPLGVVRNADAGPDWAHIETLVAEWRPQRLIVGMPRHADGSASELGNEVSRFVADLGRFGLPVETVDERYSSIDAQELLKARRAAGLQGRIRKELIDAAAAVLIAERWLKREL
jgi:putative Holliday junction resolvase